MMKRFSLLICVALLGIISMSAQTPIRWTIAVNKTSATEGTVTLTANIDEGWHLYGTEIPDGGPKPTSFSFEGSENVKFDGALKSSLPLTSVDDPVFGVKLSWWAKTVSFTRKYKVVDKKSAAKINATVSYMACNDENCMPPKKQTLTATVK